jgi:uncharacterized membrane protein
MLGTVVLLLICALTAITGLALILKLVPPNDIFGVRTERALAREDHWYEVNWFAGCALVAAAGVTALTVMIYSSTLLRSFWLQLLAFLVIAGIAVGASLWYERQVTLHGVRWSPQKKKRSRRRHGRPAEANRHS